MKKKYIKPEFEYTKFEIEDVITASGLTVDDGTGDDIIDWGNIK